MRAKVEEALDRKIKTYALLELYRDCDLEQSRGDINIIEEYEKTAIELNAQIKLLRFLLDE
jgi:hypothetical protein